MDTQITEMTAATTATAAAAAAAAAATAIINYEIQNDEDTKQSNSINLQHATGGFSHQNYKTTFFNIGIWVILT